MALLLTSSSTGLAKMYFCGSAMSSGYGSKTRFKTRFFDKENQLNFSTLMMAQCY